MLILFYFSPSCSFSTCSTLSSVVSLDRLFRRASNLEDAEIISRWNDNNSFDLQWFSSCFWGDVFFDVLLVILSSLSMLALLGFRISDDLWHCIQWRHTGQDPTLEAKAFLNLRTTPNFIFIIVPRRCSSRNIRRIDPSTPCSRNIWSINNYIWLIIVVKGLMKFATLSK